MRLLNFLIHTYWFHTLDPALTQLCVLWWAALHGHGCTEMNRFLEISMAFV